MDSHDSTGKGGSVTLPPDLSDDTDPAAAEKEHEQPSLMGDVEALIADGKTYLEAELTFQKSRAGFAANRFKWMAIYGAAAFGFIHLALIALTVGLVMALIPVLGPWIATIVVVIVLMLGAAGFAMKLRAKLVDLRETFNQGQT